MIYYFTCKNSCLSNVSGKIIVPLGEWEKNPRLQPKTLGPQHSLREAGELAFEVDRELRPDLVPELVEAAGLHPTGLQALLGNSHLFTQEVHAAARQVCAE